MCCLLLEDMCACVCGRCARCEHRLQADSAHSRSALCTCRGACQSGGSDIATSVCFANRRRTIHFGYANCTCTCGQLCVRRRRSNGGDPCEERALNGAHTTLALLAGNQAAVMTRVRVKKWRGRRESLHTCHGEQSRVSEARAWTPNQSRKYTLVADSRNRSREVE
jgi:hypothetical protein